MKLKVQNNTGSVIARGGFVFPPNGKWYEIDVPEYRSREITSAAFLNVKLPGESIDEPEPESEPDMVEVEESETETDEGRSDEGDGWDDEEEDDAADFIEGDEDDEEVDLDELSYSDLQAMAKERGIRANQNREDLVEAILEADEEE